MYRVSQFQGGQSTYLCQRCGKRTRDTGYGEWGIDYCLQCFVEGGLAIEHVDNGHDSVRFEEGIKCPSCPEGVEMAD
jgi:C4-type Zn-finger protein